MQMYLANKLCIPSHSSSLNLGKTILTMSFLPHIFFFDEIVNEPDCFVFERKFRWSRHAAQFCTISRMTKPTPTNFEKWKMRPHDTGVNSKLALCL